MNSVQQAISPFTLKTPSTPKHRAKRDREGRNKEREREIAEFERLGPIFFGLFLCAAADFAGVDRAWISKISSSGSCTKAMASITSPLLLQPSWACKLSTPGASFTNSYQEMTVKISLGHTLRLSSSMQGKALHYRCRGGSSISCQAVVTAEYRRGGGGGGGGGDFMAGFLLGGVVFGALGYLLAPQITKSISEEIEKQEGDGPPKKAARFLEDDEGLEVGLYNHADPSTNKTRKNLNEKIAQLNAAIDDVSAQLRSEDGLGIPNAGTAELESAA